MASPQITRKTNVFERLLLLVGVAISIIGIFLLNAIFKQQGNSFTPELLIALLVWLLLIFIMILCAISENQREELSIIINEHIKETRFLREISKEHLDEIKMMRDHYQKRK